MKKQFFYLVLSAVVGVSCGACSSDDEKDAVLDPVNLSTPEFSQQAKQYTLEPAVSEAKENDGDGNGKQLKSIDLSESGKLLLELSTSDGNKPFFYLEDATIGNKTMKMNGKKVRGSVQELSSESGANGGSGLLVLDIEVTNEDGSTLSFKTGADGANVVMKSSPTTDEATLRLARTWNVLGAILDLKSKKKNVKAYEEFDSRNGMFYLEDVLKEALEQGVKLTDEEQQEFKRVVKSITFTKTGLFIISYLDGTEDVADWSWANAAKTEISIRLRDEEMGNKFIANTSKLTVAFNGNRCNLKAETALSDKENNDWESVLLIKLVD